MFEATQPFNPSLVGLFCSLCHKLNNSNIYNENFDFLGGSRIQRVLM